MSHAQTSSRTKAKDSAASIKHRSSRGFGLPIIGAVAIVCAGLVTGAILSMLMAQIGWPFAIIFGLVALIAVLAVEIRGLFVTVASLPLLFGIATVITGWLVTRAQAADNAAPFSRTAIITSVFPLVQLFPVLMTVTIAAALIAVVRLMLRNRGDKSKEEKAQVSRRVDAEADRRNREVSYRARERNQRLSVAELVERTNNRNRRRPNTVRGGDEARSRDERRRQQAQLRESEARERIERARAAKGAVDSAHAERVERGRIAREQAEQAAARRNVERQSRIAEDFDRGRRPDPNRRAGQKSAPGLPRYDQHVAEPASYEQQTPDGLHSQSKPQRKRKRHSRLDDNLYGD